MMDTEGLRAARRAGIRWLKLGLLIAAAILTTIVVRAQGVSTTTVQDTVYLANGQPGSGTLTIRWPAFTTAAGQAVAAGSLTTQISGDGFLSVSLAPNQGATPAGLFYTAVFYLSDGSTSTEYWVVPATATATLAQIRAQVMPAAQAVQAVSKAYVDQSISQLSQSVLTASGGTLSAPLYLNGDPTQALQAADKHYVDAQVATAVPIAGGTMTGALTLGGDPTQDTQAADKHYVDATATAAAALATQGALSLSGGTLTGAVNGTDATFAGTVAANTAFSGPGTGLTGNAANLTAGTATHAQNIPGDFATQSASTPSSATFTGVTATAISGNVNGVYSVATYGAVGDCTGRGSTATCTDNTTAIQAAFDAAYATGGSVFFPTNISAAGETIYYVGSAINPRGVSFYGPAGASGGQNTDPNSFKVAVRGAPGKDVFAVGDPTSVGYVLPKTHFSVRDISILIDDTVDASASFPNRKPGHTAFDGSITSGSATLTSPFSYFTAGDVGRAIRVYGAGAAGANLDTTITAYNPSTTYSGSSSVTLASNAGTTVSGAQVYTSVADLSVTQTIGNCGFAYDNANSPGYVSYGILGGDFSHVNVDLINNSPVTNANHACGFLFQGAAGVYQTRWENDYVGAPFAMVFIPSTGSASINTSNATGLADFNVFDHVWLQGAYPWISYGGNQNTLSNMQTIGGHYGPQILAAESASGGPTQWHIDIPEQEVGLSGQTCTAGGADVSFRITGSTHTVTRLTVPHCTNGMTFQWDAKDSDVVNLATNSTSSFAVSGSRNKIRITSSFSGFPTAWNVTGAGNTIETGFNSGPYQDKQAGRIQYVNGGSTTFGPAQAARGAIAFNRAADFIRNDVSAYFFNSEDLWIWPQEMLGGSSWRPAYTADATSESGAALNVTVASNGYLTGSNGTNWYWGSQMPSIKFRYYVKAKADSGTPTESFTIRSSTLGTLCSISATLSTSWQVFSCDGDATGATGSQVQTYLNAPSAGTAYIAWTALRPYTAAVESSLQVGTTGIAMTANHGTGTSIQHSDGTGNSNAPAFFDANGNIAGLSLAAPSTDSYLHWNGTAWGYASPSGTFTAGGDLSGTSSSQTVVGIKGSAVPTLASGYLHYNGSSWVFDTPSGSMTWPTTPGITVCAGTPCTAWGTSLTAPTGAIVGTTDTQTLTGKTLDGVTPTTMSYLDATSSIQTQLNGKQASGSYALQSTTINGHALSSNVTVTASDVGLGSVTNDAQTKAAIVPNTAPAAGQLLVGNAGGTAYAAASMSGDAAIASTGAITVSKYNGGTSFGTAAAISSTAGGDLSGTLPSPTVAGIKGTSVPTLASGYLHYNGSAFVWDTPGGASYPAAGIPISTGSAWGTSLSETDGNLIYGAAGAWTKGTALPNGITATTQSAADNSTKVATTAYVDSAVASGSGGGPITGLSGLTPYTAYYITSGGTYTQAKADAVGTTPAFCVASLTTTCTYSGVITNGSWTWTVGGVIYLSDSSAGALTQTAPTTSGHYVQRVGVAIAATKMLVMPSLDAGGIQ